LRQRSQPLSVKGAGALLINAGVFFINNRDQFE
jgi:hypothetical protein